ncbi:MAG: hypothetical protein H3C31_06160 [Brumimicrobium sp.]|nr:hypothetical protein [Brumimicrobium sp.]
MTEKKIQEYLWKNRERFWELIEEIDIPAKRVIDNPDTIQPADIIYNNLVEKFKDYYNDIFTLDLFGCEVPLKKDNDSTIRADFLATMDSKGGISIIELKKNKQTERQAYTELLAYGSHIRTVFSPMSKMDVNYVLISPMEERIVREATIQSFLFDNIYVFALIPEYTNDDLNTLKLKPWIPTFTEVNQVISSVFSESNFDVFKITWDALPGEWSPLNKGENPDSYMIERLNKVSEYAAQMMSEKGIHGFTYASQTWSELIDSGYLLNSLVICGLNPFKASKNRYLINDCGVKLEEASEIDISMINLLDIIPELKYNSQKINEDNNYFEDLSNSWDSTLWSIGFEVVDILTMSTNRDYIETGHGGGISWKQYQEFSREDVYCHNFDIKMSGLIKELFFGYSKVDYEFMRENGQNKHPIYSAFGVPEDFVDLIGNQYVSRGFIKRLFYSDEYNTDS